VIAADATAAAQLEAARKRVAAADAQVGEARAAQRAAADQYKQSLSQITGTQAQVGPATGRLSEANSAPQQVAVRRGKNRFEMLINSKEHEMHHRAQLMVIERLLGIVPHPTRNRQRPKESAQRSTT